MLTGFSIFLLLAFLSASFAIRSRLLLKHEELLRRAEREGTTNDEALNELAWDALRMTR